MESWHLIGCRVWILSWYSLYEEKPQPKIELYSCEEDARAVESSYHRAGGYSTFVQPAKIRDHPRDWMGREI